MALPIIQNIALTIIDRIKAIDPVNGYFNKVRKFVQPTREGKNCPVEHLTGYVALGTNERLPALDLPGQGSVKAFRQHYEVWMYLKPSDKDETPIDVHASLLMSDLLTAICGDRQWLKFVRNDVRQSMNADIDEQQLAYDGDGNIGGVMLRITADYRHALSDPKTPVGY